MDFNRHKKIWFLIVFFSSNAFARSNAVVTIVHNLTDYLSGEIAAAISVLVIIYSGYELIGGQISKNNFFVRIAAVGLIFGGSYIASDYIFRGVMS